MTNENICFNDSYTVQYASLFFFYNPSNNRILSVFCCTLPALAKNIIVGGSGCCQFDSSAIERYM